MMLLSVLIYWQNEGYGEIIGGSERATDYDYLYKEIEKLVWIPRNIVGTLT